MIILEHYNTWIVIALMMIGFFITIARGSLVKKLIGLNLLQTSVFIFYISIGKVNGGTAPIYSENALTYSNPLPHVLILTAIVVGIATLALALSIVVRIQRAYGTVEEDELREEDQRC